jgi:hypothetical protein
MVKCPCSLQNWIYLPVFGSGSFGVFIEEKCLGLYGLTLRGKRSFN